MSLTRAFRHGLRVRMGAIDGPRGVLLRCETRGGVPYWKVRLQGLPVRWVRPDGLIVDGPGDRVIPACAACGLPYISDGDPICERCRAEQFGTATARYDDAAPDLDRDRRMYGWRGRRRNHA